jgi:hypothetical protein
MDQLSISIPEGLSEEQKSSLADWLSQLAMQSIEETKRMHTGSVLDFYGSLKSNQPAGTREEEREAARRHVIENYLDDDA